MMLCREAPSTVGTFNEKWSGNTYMQMTIFVIASDPDIVPRFSELSLSIRVEVGV